MIPRMILSRGDDSDDDFERGDDSEDDSEDDLGMFWEMLETHYLWGA